MKDLDGARVLADRYLEGADAKMQIPAPDTLQLVPDDVLGHELVEQAESPADRTGTWTAACSRSREYGGCHMMTSEPQASSARCELVIGGVAVELELDPDSSITPALIAALPIAGPANQIQGELFVYTTDVDIPFDGSQVEVHQPGDVVYWRAGGGARRFGILVMHGPTTYGDGSEARSNGAAIRFARVASDLDRVRAAQDGDEFVLRTASNAS